MILEWLEKKWHVIFVGRIFSKVKFSGNFWLFFFLYVFNSYFLGLALYYIL